MAKGGKGKSRGRGKKVGHTKAMRVSKREALSFVTAALAIAEKVGVDCDEIEKMWKKCLERRK